MNSSEDIQCFKVEDLKLISRYKVLKISYFQEFLGKYVRQCFNAGGTVYYSLNRRNEITGILIMNEEEGEGAIFVNETESLSVLASRAGNIAMFSEINLPIRGDKYLIMESDLSETSNLTSFGNSVEILKKSELSNLMDCINAIYPRTRVNSIKTSLDDGDICFVVRAGESIVGFAFVSISGNIGRLPLFGVLPEFRGLGIGSDLVRARILFLRQIGLKKVFSEIKESNSESMRISQKFGFRKAGVIWLYFPESGSWSATVRTLGKS